MKSKILPLAVVFSFIPLGVVALTWNLGGDPDGPAPASWCEGQQVWEEGAQGIPLLKTDCLLKNQESRCELVTKVRNGRTSSTAQCVPR